MSDPNYEIKKDFQYDEKVRALQNNDRAHAETVLNPLMEKMVNNTHSVKLMADKINNVHVADKDIHVSLDQKAAYLDKYTKVEIDNKFAEFEYGLDWKESVDTFADIAKYYPKPEDGWTVNTKDNNYTYRYDEETKTWIEISANAIPLATKNIDGKMSKEYAAKLDGIDTGANKYIHPASGVTAGTYRSVTVNTEGHVTAATNPTVTVAQGGTGATTAADARTNLGVPPTSHASAEAAYGVSSAANYGHSMASSAAPLVAGTAAAGTDNGKYAREGHVHPVQTSVSGNAGTATKLQTARTIGLSGDASGSGSFDGSANLTVATTLANTGVTAGAYGPTAAVSPGYGAAFNVPQVTVDAKGRVTAAANRAITLPAAYSHPTFSASTVGEAENKSLSYGGTFTIPQVGRDGNGHVSTLAAKTMTMPAQYTHPTAAGNKHIPSGGSSGQILRWSADGTAVWGADNNTTYTAGTGLGLSGTTFSHNNNGTAGTYGPTANVNAAGSGFKVPQFTTNEQGHITAVTERTMTFPASYTHPTTTGNKHIPTGGSSGQILRWSSDGTAAWGADNNTTYTAGTGMSLSGTTFNHQNYGTAGTYRSVTVNAQGHVTAGSNPTVTVAQGGTGATTATEARTNLGAASTAIASTSANGLMSSSDKTKLDGFPSKIILSTSTPAVVNGAVWIKY